jgi:hypothetical protein
MSVSSITDVTDVDATTAGSLKEIEQCKFGSKCNNPKCRYFHGNLNVEQCKFGHKCHHCHCLNFHTEEQQNIRKHLLESYLNHSKIIDFLKKINICQLKMEEEDNKYKIALSELESKKLKKIRAKSMTRARSKTRVAFHDDDDEDEIERLLIEELQNIKERKDNKVNKEIKERGRTLTRDASS